MRGVFLEAWPRGDEIGGLGQHFLVDVAERDDLDGGDLDQPEQVGLAVPSAADQPDPLGFAALKGGSVFSADRESQPAAEEAWMNSRRFMEVTPLAVRGSLAVIRGDVRLKPDLLVMGRLGRCPRCGGLAAERRAMSAAAEPGRVPHPATDTPLFSSGLILQLSLSNLFGLAAQARNETAGKDRGQAGAGRSTWKPRSGPTLTGEIAFPTCLTRFRFLFWRSWRRWPR